MAILPFRGKTKWSRRALVYLQRTASEQNGETHARGKTGREATMEKEDVIEGKEDNDGSLVAFAVHVYDAAKSEIPIRDHERAARTDARPVHDDDGSFSLSLLNGD